jgi:hypothetical protein
LTIGSNRGALSSQIDHGARRLLLLAMDLEAPAEPKHPPSLSDPPRSISVQPSKRSFYQRNKKFAIVRVITNARGRQLANSTRQRLLHHKTNPNH